MPVLPAFSKYKQICHTGWLNSFTGMMNYMKLKLASNGKQQKDEIKTRKDKEKLKSLASVSPMHNTVTTNPFAQTPLNPATGLYTNVQTVTTTTTSHQIYDQRHRSPDPPPRLSRGNQSPLILRRKLELAQSGGSPLMHRR